MNELLFDWDEANIRHISAHGVKPEEAEFVVLGDPLEMEFEKSELAKIDGLI